MFKGIHTERQISYKFTIWGLQGGFQFFFHINVVFRAWKNHQKHIHVLYSVCTSDMKTCNSDVKNSNYNQMSEWPQRQWADNFTYLGLLLTDYRNMSGLSISKTARQTYFFQAYRWRCRRKIWTIPKRLQVWILCGQIKSYHDYCNLPWGFGRFSEYLIYNI